MTKLRSSNYFKSIRNQFYPFADNVVESIQAAYDMATREDPNPSVYRPTIHSGPWDRCSVVGHRSRAAIFQDLALCGDDEVELDRLHKELTALHEVFLNSGRSIPLQAVA
jgi:hypothetical protein